VMQWDSYPTRQHDGVVYGMKSRSFEPYFDLPRRVSANLEMCVGGRGTPHSRLLQSGWLLENPLEITYDPWTYQRYIQGSQGEFSVAKHGYVVSRSGWFSERTACYLASGRPVIVEDTGFSRFLPVGRGVHSFSDPQSAAAAIDICHTDLAAQAKAAREIARALFDYRVVLNELLNRVQGAVGAP